MQVDRPRLPYIDISTIPALRYEAKSRWHHAENQAAASAERNRSTDDRRVAAKAPAPEFVTQDNYRRGARPSILRREGASQLRRDAERRKQAGRRLNDIDRRRPVRRRQNPAAHVESSQPVECLRPRLISKVIANTDHFVSTEN